MYVVEVKLLGSGVCVLCVVTKAAVIMAKLW